MVIRAVGVDTKHSFACLCDASAESWSMGLSPYENETMPRSGEELPIISVTHTNEKTAQHTIVVSIRAKAGAAEGVCFPSAEQSYIPQPCRCQNPLSGTHLNQFQVCMYAFRRKSNGTEDTLAVANHSRGRCLYHYRQFRALVYEVWIRSHMELEHLYFPSTLFHSILSI